MTVLSDLIAEIGAQLPTGVSHEITAAKLRTVLSDMVTQLSQVSGSGGGTAERYLTTGSTANPGDICYCNTQAGGFAVTLPDAPIPGTGVGFRDAESSWSTANLTVFPGSNRIENTPGNLICDVTNANFDLVWSGTPEGWELVPAISLAGAGGGVGAGATYYHITSNQAAVAGATYYCDTLAGSFTVTLPPGPALGSGISFKDASGNWSTFNLILNPGSNPIASVAGSLAIDQSDINFDVVWRGLPIGWQVEIPVSEAARGIAGSAGFLTTRPLGALGQVATATRGTGVTWNAADKSSNITLSGGNLIATATGTGNVRGNTVGSAGRYFEVVWSAHVVPGFGLATATQSLSAYPGDPNGIGFFGSGYVEWPGSGTSNNTGVSWGDGDVMGILLGTANAQLFKNGTLIYTVSVLPSGALYPILSMTSGESATANFGATAMGFLPSGATSWDGSRTSAGAVTWNASDRSGLTLSNGNLTASGTLTGGNQARATRSGSATRYFEVKVDAVIPGSIYVGLANNSQNLTSGYASNPNGICYFDNGYAEWPGSGSSGSGATYGVNDVIGVELLASSAQFFKNGTLQFTALLPSGSLFPIIGVYHTSSQITADFGATAFQHLPSGAVGWNT
jgi:hypothetical protein